MSKPNDEEVQNWRQHVDLLVATSRKASGGEPQAFGSFNHDLRQIALFIAQPGEYKRPLGSIFRMVSRVGRGICPNASQRQARVLGLTAIGQLRTIFDLQLREDWSSNIKTSIENYDHACLETFFIERVYDLSKPGGVSDRVEQFKRGEIPRNVVELDLALQNRGQLSRSDALRQAALETGRLARLWFGYLPKRWNPYVSDRRLQERHAQIMQPHLLKGYWGREGGLARPNISIYSLKRGPGRPRKI